MDTFLPEELLFEIPVYRVSLDQYLKDEAIKDLAEKPEWGKRSSEDLEDYINRWATCITPAPIGTTR